MISMNKSLALAVLASLSFSAVAQDEQVLNSDPIDVDGYLQEKQVTDGELEMIKQEHGKQKTMTTLNKEKSKELGKLAGQTEKLLDSQDQYIDSKIESQKAIKEFNKKSAENEKRLKCLLEESDSPDCAKWVKKRQEDKQVAVVEDAVKTGQAAPVVVAPAPVDNAPLKPFEEIKLIPFAGVTNYQGEVEKLESEFTGGIRLESNVNERLSMGVGFNYAQFTTQDFGGTYNSQPYFTGYFNSYGSSREIGYKNMGLDLYAKFFITRGERFRPYVGAGVGYNRMTLNYADNNAFQGNNFGNNFGNEETTTSYATGSLSAGTEILITRAIGLNVEFQFTRGFGGGSSDNGVSTFNAPDQRRLQELSDELVEANALSIFAGMVVIF
jgi:opacity protein-like surface antigen